VTFTGVPSFVEALDVPLEVPGVGDITVDVAFGGCFYVLVDAAALGVRLTREAARDVVERAELVMAAAGSQLAVRHPAIPEIDFLSYVMVTGDDDPVAGRLRGATVLGGRVDRSPCGTGTSARLACLAARGLAGPGSRFLATSLIDSEFAVAVTGTASVGGRQAIVPSISGRGWIFGTRTVTVDPTDPYPTGFTLTDLWGRQPVG
jgi:proline racemase